MYSFILRFFFHGFIGKKSRDQDVKDSKLYPLFLLNLTTLNIKYEKYLYE